MSYDTEKRQFKVYFFVISLVLTFVLGIAVGKKYDVPEGRAIGGSAGEDLSSSDMKVLWEAWDVINKKYGGDLPDKKKVVEGAAKGLVSSLDDPYTVFWNEQESEDFTSEMEGSFEGIGTEIGIRNQVLTIISPLDGTPAARAGLRAGDKIFKIDDVITSDITLDEAIKKIRGQKGTKVHLTVIRSEGDNPEPLEFDIVRDRIDVKSVSWELRDDTVAYIRLSAFLKDTEAEFDKVVQEVGASKADRIVLDLRSNPGGYLETAVDTAGTFLPKGSLVVTEDYGELNKLRNKEHYTSGNQALVDYPIVVIVNEGTASAAEILAGALKDTRDVQLVGKKTFGKGSVQEVARLNEGGSIKVTVAKWRTPKGANIDKEGINPSIEQEFGENQEDDLQVKKAIEIVKGIR